MGIRKDGGTGHHTNRRQPYTCPRRRSPHSQHSVYSTSSQTKHFESLAVGSKPARVVRAYTRQPTQEELTLRRMVLAHREHPELSSLARPSSVTPLELAGPTVYTRPARAAALVAASAVTLTLGRSAVARSLTSPPDSSGAPPPRQNRNSTRLALRLVARVAVTSKFSNRNLT